MEGVNEFILNGLNQAIEESDLRKDSLDLSFLCQKFDIPNPLQDMCNKEKEENVSHNILKLRDKFEYSDLCNQNQKVCSDDLWFNFNIKPFLDYCQKNNYTVEITDMYIRVNTLVNNWMITPNPNGSKLNLLHTNKFLMWKNKYVAQDYHNQLSNKMSEYGLYEILHYIDRHDKRILRKYKRSDRLLELFKEIEK